jgi:hypothetical protein
MPEDNMSAAATGILAVSSEFDIFVHKPIHTSVLETIETVYQPIAPVEQSDLEFLIPADTNIYFNVDIKLYIGGKLIFGERKDFDKKLYGCH